MVAPDYLRFVLSSVLLLASGLALAEPAPFDLGTIVVTADVDDPVLDSLASSIDAGTMRKFERNDLAEALKLSPGVTMSNTGPRNEAGVNVRGFDLRQVPVFIDGIPVYVPYDGYVDLRRFSTYDVAEIRVSKGFSSALYGPNSLGGAINVVTRRPERPLEGDILAGWFQEAGYQAALNVGMRKGNWYTQFSGSFLDVDSYPLSNDFRPIRGEDGGQRDNAYREDWKVSAKVGYTPNDTDEYALGYIYQQGEKGNPVYAGIDPLNRRRFWQWPQWDKQTVYFIGNTQVTPDFYIKERLYGDQFKNSLFAFDNSRYNTQTLPSSFQSYYDDYTVGGSIEAGMKFGERDSLKVALHGKFDHHKEHNQGAAFSTYEDTTFSLGAEHTHEFNDQLSVVAGLSYDRRDVLAAVDPAGNVVPRNAFDALNPQLGLFYKLKDEGTLHLTAARKSRFPTIKDRYSARLGQALPNPGLQPESAIHFELGYDGQVRKDLTLHASVFMAEIEDTIQRVDNVAVGPGPAFTPLFQLQNVGRSRHMGTELGFDYQPCEALQLGINYTYLDRKNESQPNVKLIDTPRNSVFGYAEVRPVEWLSVIPSLEYGGSRWSTTYGVESRAYAVTNLKVAVRLPRGVTLRAGVNNLLDRNYTLTEGFPEAGRSLFVNVQVEF